MYWYKVDLGPECPIWWLWKLENGERSVHIWIKLITSHLLVQINLYLLEKSATCGLAL